MEKDKRITLLLAQGFIAACAIENPKDHDLAYKRITKLIEKHGPFREIREEDIKLFYAKLEEGEV